MFDSVFCLGNVRRSRTGGITMAELRPDQAQLAKQGQAGLSPYPYTPNVPQDLVANSNQFSTDLLGRLGNVMADQAIRRQEMLNSTLVTDALNTATSELNKITQAQLERKGWQVGKQSATDTTEERQDAMTEYTQTTEQLINNMLPKFTNDKQREMFSMQITNSIISGADVVSKHMYKEHMQLFSDGYQARLTNMQNDAIDLAEAGDLDGVQRVLQDVKNYIPMANASIGKSKEAVQLELDTQMNKILGSIADVYTQAGRTAEFLAFKTKFADSLATGATASAIQHQGNALKRQSEAMSLAESVANDPSIYAEDGTVDDAKLAEAVNKACMSTTVTQVARQTGAGGRSSIDKMYQTVVLTERTPDGRTSPDGAQGIEQMIPSTFEGIKEQHPDTIPADASLSDPYWAKVATMYLLEDLGEKSGWRLDAMAVGYNKGESTMKEYMQDPSIADRIYTGSDMNETVSQYINRWVANYNSLGGTTSSTMNKPTLRDIPISPGDAPNINGLNDYWGKGLIQWVGGRLADMGYDNTELTSGKRDPDGNSTVNGADGSDHLKGDAIDISLGEGVSVEEGKKVAEYFQNTGLFRYCDYHDYGTGWHLHVGGFQGDINNLLSGAIGATVTYSTTTHTELDPAFMSLVYQQSGIISNSKVKNEAIARNEAVSLLYYGNYSSPFEIENALRAVTYKNKFGQQVHLTDAEIAEAIPKVQSTNHKQWAFAEQQKNRTLALQDIQDNNYKALESYSGYMLTHPNATYDEVIANTSLSGADNQTKQRVYNSFQSGTQRTLAGIYSQADKYAQSYAKGSWKNSTQAYYSIRQYIEGKAYEQFTQTGQAPTQLQMETWAKEGSASVVVDKGFLGFGEKTIPYSTAEELRSKDYKFGDDGTVTNPQGQEVIPGNPSFSGAGTYFVIP